MIQDILWVVVFSYEHARVQFICSKEIKSVSGNPDDQDVSIGRAIATKIASYFKFESSNKWSKGGKKYAKKLFLYRNLYIRIQM